MNSFLASSEYIDWQHPDVLTKAKELATGIDTRGNKEGEADLPEIWSKPLSVVTDFLNNHNTYLEVAENLPDIELFQ